MKRIVIFASGSGTNAQRIAEYFDNNPNVAIIRIYCNKKDAYVLKRAEILGIPATIFNRDDFYNSDKINSQLQQDRPDLIVLAGFLWLIPNSIIKLFPNKIINIHPALLPKYGGKGMYGSFVHEAIIKANEKESGITIHYVNEYYDEGMTIFQAKCEIEEKDTPENLAAKIHQLEYKHFPEVIENILNMES